MQDSKILNQANDDVPYYDYITKQLLDLKPTTQVCLINIGTLISGGQNHQLVIDQSTHNTFNFYDCNIGLQGQLNDLSQLLIEAGESEEAKELENAAKALEQLEQCQSKEEVKKKGIANRLRRLLDNLDDKDSKLNKTVKGIKNGINIAQDIAKGYNKIAEWVGMPQVPKPFLKK